MLCISLFAFYWYLAACEVVRTKCQEPHSVFRSELLNCCGAGEALGAGAGCVPGMRRETGEDGALTKGVFAEVPAPPATASEPNTRAS